MCIVQGCDVGTLPQLGHSLCAVHCACLTTVDDMYWFNPALCDLCISFFLTNFVGVTDFDALKTWRIAREVFSQSFSFCAKT